MKSLLTACFVLALTLFGCRRSHPVRDDPAQNGKAAYTAIPTSEAVKTSELHVSDPLFQNRLLRGFYEGTEGWKWTGREFAVSLNVPPPVDAPIEFQIDFMVPEELMQTVHNVTVTARLNGGEVGKVTFTEPGRHTPSFPVPPALLKTDPVVVQVNLDHWGTDENKRRDIGLIVVGMALKHADSMVLEHDTASEMARRGYAELLERRQLQIPQERQNEMMKLFHDIPVWRHMWFQNVPIGKNPLDLWMYQQIIYETRPEFIVETGTYMGGSALYWAHTLNGMGLENSRVITVDIDDFTTTAVKHPLWKKYITFLKGSSADPAIVAQIAQQVKGHRTLVTLDSDHSMQHVLKEIHAYAPMVNRGSYLVVEDTHMDGVPTQADFGPGPMAAVLEYLKTGGRKDFEQDLSREAFIMTFNPGGWLRRK